MIKPEKLELSLHAFRHATANDITVRLMVVEYLPLSVVLTESAIQVFWPTFDNTLFAVGNLDYDRRAN